MVEMVDVAWLSPLIQFRSRIARLASTPPSSLPSGTSILLAVVIPRCRPLSPLCLPRCPAPVRPKASELEYHCQGRLPGCNHTASGKGRGRATFSASRSQCILCKVARPLHGTAASRCAGMSPPPVNRVMTSFQIRRGGGRHSGMLGNRLRAKASDAACSNKIRTA